ncbi:MAG: PQQ-binding-like beta-propeller repeat protein [Rhodospirillaceae bacterium]|nr:PQQ-binding-like beta-propeller repeat protein [Rhodospirillaceae bacterium]
MSVRIKAKGKSLNALAAVLMVSALGMLGGCESLTGPGAPFGPDLKVPLPGERISVLLHQRSLNPDPEIAGKEITLPAPTPNTNWPQAGGTASHAMHHIAINETISNVWRADVGDASDDEVRIVGSPIVADGRAYAMDSLSNVSAFDAGNGKRLWTVELTPEEEEDDHISGGLAYENGRVFVTTGFAQVVALDAGNGALLWRKSLPGPMRSAPTARGGRVFAITVDSRVFALSATTGEELWNYTGIAEVASLLGGASPAVDQGVVVAPFASGELVALKAENGRILWTDSLTSRRRTDVVSTLSHIRGRPIIDRGRVFAISHGGLMVSIDLRSGRRIWDKEIGGLASPWVAGDYIFLLTNDAEVAASSRENGSIFWVQTLPRFEDPVEKDSPIVWTGPVLASDRLIITGSHGEVYSVSPYSGDIMGSVEMPSGISVPPIVAGGSVYFLANSATLVAYR